MQDALTLDSLGFSLIGLDDTGCFTQQFAGDGATDMSRLLTVLIVSAALGGTAAAAPQSVSGGRRQVDCSRPKAGDTESSPIGEPESGAFQTPQPTGVVRGEANTLEFELGKFRLPALTLSLPALQLPSIARVRRDPVMHTDEATAPFSRQALQRFEMTPSGDDESAPLNRPAEPEAAPFQTPAAEDAPRCNPPCVPAVPREGCLTQNGATSDAQVARLEAQMAVLQQAVTQLVQVQVQANAAAAQQQQRSQAVPAMPAAAPAAPATVRPAARPRQVEQEPQLEQESAEQPVDVPTVVARPVRQISAAEGEVRVSAEARQLRQQAAQIEELQRQLDELKRAQTPAAKAPAAAPAANVSAGAAKATGAGTAGRAKLGGEPQAKKSMNPFSGLLGGLSKGR